MKLWGSNKWPIMLRPVRRRSIAETRCRGGQKFWNLSASLWLITNCQLRHLLDWNPTVPLDEVLQRVTKGFNL